MGGRRPYLRKNKVYFGKGIKRSQRGDGIFRAILSTALPLVGEIVKVFKQKKTTTTTKKQKKREKKK